MSNGSVMQLGVLAAPLGVTASSAGDYVMFPQAPAAAAAVPAGVGGTAVVCGPLVGGYVAGKIVKKLTPADTSPAGKIIAGAATGAAIGAAIGTAIPGLGTAAGAAIGAVCGAIGAWFS